MALPSTQLVRFSLSSTPSGALVYVDNHYLGATPVSGIPLDARQKARLEKYDTDKDGKLSEEENRKMFEDLRKQRPGGGTRPGGGGTSEEKKPEPAKVPVPETK